MQSGRINKFDNMKGLAIFMIVLWHLDSLEVIDPNIRKFLFISALPIFFFVSGYFSKIGPEEPIKAFKRLFVPYIIFTIITKLFNFILYGKAGYDMIFIYTSFALWFLIALFFMKMSLPIFDRLRYPLIISIIIALFSGFLSLDYEILGLTRAFCYFPIFLIGFYYNDYKETLQTKYARISSFFKRFNILFVVLGIAYIVINVYTMRVGIILFKSQYSGNLLYEMIKRFMVIIAEIILVLLLNKFMTNKHCFLTVFGINSMAVYLLHCYIKIYAKTIFIDVFTSHEMIFIPFVIIFSFVVTYVLSRDFVTKYLNKLLDLVNNVIVKPAS